jgi:peptidyl-prolyl cis-trans isomerase D
MKKTSILIITLLLLITSGLMAVQTAKKKTPAKKTTSAVKKPPTRQVVGTIGTKKIYLDEYKAMLTNYTQYWQNKGEKITPESKKKFNNQLWEELVAKEAYNKDIKARKLTVTKAELDARTISNPPEQVKGIPQLQTNGKFDSAKFKMAIEKDSVFKRNVQAVIMDSYPYEKLFNTIKAKVKIKPDSVKNDYIAKNDKASAKIINFDWHTMKNITVADSEMMSYYQKNLETYKRDPARIVRYIKVTFDPSSADSLKAKAKADSIYQSLVAGSDFAEMAKKFSQDPGSGANGGDLGYFGKGRMVPEFENTAFALEPGKISAPFTTRFGWHIIKTYEKRKNEQGQDEVKASHILIKFEASEQTKQDRKNEANVIFEKAKANGLTKAIEGTHYILQISDEFYANATYVNGIGSNEAFVKDAFAKGKNTLLEMTSNPSGEMILGEVADTMGVHYLTFDSQKESVKRTIEKDKSVIAAKALAENFYQTYGPDKYLEQAQKDSLMIVDADDITINSPINRLGNVKPLSEAIFHTELNKYTSLITNEKGNWIAYVTKRTRPDMKDWEKSKNSLIKEAREKAEQQQLSKWYVALKSSITVVDNRKKFFSDL